MSQWEQGQHGFGDASFEQVSIGLGDQEALDALIEADYRIERVREDGDLRVRAERLALLLGVLETPEVEAGARESLIGRTMDLLAAAQMTTSMTRANANQSASARNTEAEPTESRGWISEEESGLTPLDRDAIEALVGAGFEPSRVSSGVRERAERHSRLLGLLGAAMAFSEAERETRVTSTLSFVQAGIESQQGRLRFEPVLDRTERSTRAWRWSDLVSVAAVLAIGSGVLWPMVSGMRERSRQMACLGNFGVAKTAFGQYAGDNQSSMPMATASIAGLPWWNVGKPEESNTANMFHLARTGYTTLEPLGCPCNGVCFKGRNASEQKDFTCMSEVSYSMQNLFARERPRFGEGDRTVILADRSPVTVACLKNRAADPMANSPNHGGRGQNVLFNDGSALWLTSPVMKRGGDGGIDNIWLPEYIEIRVLRMEVGRDQAGNPVVVLEGVEEPGSARDSFLCP